MSSELTPVQEFYKGKTVFITGASGFMGKVLLEKLLYSCSELNQVIILMRPKREKTPEIRLEEMFKLPLFKRINDEKPHVLKKVTLVQGDVTIDDLGLSESDLKLLINNVNIVYHMAATLKLEGNLTDAINMNLTGTQRTLNIARQMKNLLVFIHLSTAFCNCDQEVMYEKVYEFHHKPEDLMRMAEWMDVKQLDKITPELIKPHPNTYTYSKRLAEILVRDQYPDMPVIITRPSIVLPSYQEPIPGWVDNMNGPTGIMIGASKAVIRSMHCDGSLDAEVVPVDYAINGIIVIPYEWSLFDTKPDHIPVYNMTCSEDKRTTWKEIMDTGRRYGLEYPFNVGYWYPDGNITTNRYYHWFCAIFFMWLPAVLIDCLLFIFGQRRFMIRVQKKIHNGLEVLQFFTTRNWDFKSTNFARLYWQLLKPEEKLIFNMHMQEIDNEKYMLTSILGAKQFICKEPLSTIPRNKKILWVLYLLDRFCKFYFLYWILKLIAGKLGILERLQ